MRPEGSHQPERAFQIVPDLDFHGGVVEHIHVIGIMLLIFGKGAWIILAPLLVGLESREVLIFPHDEVSVAVLPGNLLHKVTQAFPFREQAAMGFHPFEERFHRLVMLVLFALPRMPAFHFEYRHVSALPRRRRTPRHRGARPAPIPPTSGAPTSLRLLPIATVPRRLHRQSRSCSRPKRLFQARPCAYWFDCPASVSSPRFRWRKSNETNGIESKNFHIAAHKSGRPP